MEDKVARLSGAKASDRRTFLIAALMVLVVGVSLMPAHAATPSGRWRDINPTQYISSDASGTLRGIYMAKSSGSASVGTGDGWVVGGDGTTGIISHYDGFSWHILTPPVTTAVYNSVHFCLTPGAPNVGSICNPYSSSGYVSDGWLVGGSTTAFGTCATTICPVASYWNGGTLTEKDEGLSAAGAGNLTSVFMVCNSPETGQTGCSGPFQSQGLTYAVGANAAGSHGIICSFNGDPLGGGSWGCPFTSTHAARFNGVYMYVDQTGNLGGFAVGDHGTIVQLTRGAWVETQPAVGVTLRSVFVDQGGSNLEAWAVGDALAGSAEIWHFCCGPSGSWNGPVSPGATNQNLENVFLTSTTEGWAFGSSSVILFSNTLGTSNQWLALTSPSQTATGPAVSLIGSSFPSSGAGWAVGTSGIIIDTQNSNCGNAVATPCFGGNTGITQTSNLTAVVEVSRNDAWAGGWWDVANSEPALIHWDGVKWHRAQIAPPPQLGGNSFNIMSIYMSGGNDGWAVGGNMVQPEVPFAIHWDGNSWTGASSTQPVCACALTSVFMINSGEGWAVGDGGEFFHYASNTNQWRLSQSALGSPKLNGVFIDNPGANQFAGWAVGNNGVVYSLSISGSTATWNQFTMTALGGATPNLYGVFFTDSNHGWIVGADGTILTTTNGGQGWSGGLNQVLGLSTPPTLRAVYVDQVNTGSGNGDGWAVGGTNETGAANAVFVHYDGQTWTAKTISPPIVEGLSLNSVYGQPGNTQDGWTVGTGSRVSVPSLVGVFHLDPLNPPTVSTGGGTTTIVSTIVSNSASSTFTTTLTSATTTTTSTSTSLITESTTSTSSSLSTSTTTSVGTETSTTTETFSSNTLEVPGIPGFPWEAILAGIFLGLAIVGVVRRTRK
ncbi:MAG: hypothetical protein ABSA92_05070 [Candidatus Bathyarchaeia archaeon]